MSGMEPIAIAAAVASGISAVSAGTSAIAAVKKYRKGKAKIKHSEVQQYTEPDVVPEYVSFHLILL